jgi:hypothetical protein
MIVDRDDGRKGAHERSFTARKERLKVIGKRTP